MEPTELTYDEHMVLLTARAKYNDQHHAFDMWQDAKNGAHTSEYLGTLKSLWQATKSIYDGYTRDNKPVLRVVLVEKHHKIVV